VALSVLQSLGDVRGVSRVRAVLVSGLLLVIGPGAPLAQDTGLDLARERLAAGDRAGAIETLESALPELTTSRRAEALLLLSELRDTWEAADRDLAALLDENRQSRHAEEALWRIGIRALAVGEAGRAHAAFQEALAAVPDPGRALELRFRDGQALLLMGQPGEARARLRPLLDELPPGPDADRVALLLAACAERELDHAGALRQALDLVGRESALEPAALLQAGRSLLARGEAPLALEYLGQVERDFPDTPAGAEGRVLADSLRRVLGRGRPAPPPVATDDPFPGTADPGRDPDLDPGGVPDLPPHDVPSGPPGRDGDPFASRDTAGVPGVRDRDPSRPAGAGDLPPTGDPVSGARSDTAAATTTGLPDGPGGDVPSDGEAGADPDPFEGDTAVDRSRGDVDPDARAGADRDPPAVDRPEDAPASGPASDTGRYEVVLGPFDERIGALSALSRLRREGRDDVALDLTPDGYTIRVGPITGRAAAEAEATHLGDRHGARATVVEER